jgi:hypothetical protein
MTWVKVTGISVTMATPEIRYGPIITIWTISRALVIGIASASAR